MIAVEIATDISAELEAAIVPLLRQISPFVVVPTYRQLQAIIQSPNTALLLARLEETGQLVGSLTLVVLRIPTGIHAWVGDFVVDRDYRGKGVGRKLCEVAIEEARSRSAQSITITSHRDMMNQLYEWLGFHRRQTEMYTKELND